MSPPSKPASASRSAARPATSPCAHGQALIPVASTPTTRVVTVLGRRGDPDQRDHLLRRETRDRRRAPHRPARGDVHLGPNGALPLHDVARDQLCDLLDDPRLAEARRRRSPRRTPPGSATCARPSGRGAEVDGALDLGGHHRLGIAATDLESPSARRSHPARESASSTGGADACMSATRCGRSAMPRNVAPTAAANRLTVSEQPRQPPVLELLAARLAGRAVGDRVLLEVDAAQSVVAAAGHGSPK